MMEAKNQGISFFDDQRELVANYLFKSTPQSSRYIRYIDCQAFIREWEIVSQIEKFNLKCTREIREIS